ncbi:hypothetical protein RUND412_001466 [Rhizina undulata]
MSLRCRNYLKNRELNRDWSPQCQYYGNGGGDQHGDARGIWWRCVGYVGNLYVGFNCNAATVSRTPPSPPAAATLQAMHLLPPRLAFRGAAAGLQMRLEYVALRPVDAVPEVMEEDNMVC